jgi:hypothetical protein
VRPTYKSTAKPRRRGVRPTYKSTTKLPILPTLNSSVCDRYVTPFCIRAQYGIPEGVKAAPGNALGIFETLNDHYNKADLDAYFSNVYPCVSRHACNSSGRRLTWTVPFRTEPTPRNSPSTGPLGPHGRLIK